MATQLHPNTRLTAAPQLMASLPETSLFTPVELRPPSLLKTKAYSCGPSDMTRARAGKKMEEIKQHESPTCSQNFSHFYLWVPLAFTSFRLHREACFLLINLSFFLGSLLTVSNCKPCILNFVHISLQISFFAFFTPNLTFYSVCSFSPSLPPLGTSTFTYVLNIPFLYLVNSASCASKYTCDPKQVRIMRQLQFSAYHTS